MILRPLVSKQPVGDRAAAGAVLCVVSYNAFIKDQIALLADLPRDLVGADAMFEGPYVRGENFTTVIDGFVLSPNVRAENVRMRDLDFQFSDHQPVDARFVAVK